MEEIAETAVEVTELTVHLPHLTLDIGNCFIQVETKSTKPYAFNTGTPRVVGADKAATFKTEPGAEPSYLGLHYFGTSVTDLYQSAGLRFEIYHQEDGPNTMCARGLLSFADYLTQQTNAASYTVTENCQIVEFQDVPLKDPDNITDVGVISGQFLIKNTPSFIQMYAGETIDGIVVNGKSYPSASLMPPRAVNQSAAPTLQA